MMGIMRDGLEGRIHSGNWLGSARDFTGNLKALSMMVKALETGEDVHDYP
jgi:hypothetical protein